ncbi:MAG: YjgP/YjgQ family permease [Phycisphaerales bacterium]|nr:MAG: YjgP/YjgQ family permease [Phycisphaerales bacterium]
MPSVVDRYILKMLTQNYLIALTVMMLLYVCLDLFVNVDEFTEHGLPAAEVMGNVASYYLPNLSLYFSQLSGVITLFACLLTIARTRRQNELTALLSSGISLYRVAVPIILFSLVTTALLIVDTEWVIPKVAHQLSRRHDDVSGRQAYVVRLMPDRGGALLSAARFVPDRRQLHRMTVVERDDTGALRGVIEADRATWVNVPGLPGGGRWVLERGLHTRPAVPADSSAFGARQQRVQEAVQYYESDLNPRTIQMRQSEQWIRFLSLSDLRSLEPIHTAGLGVIRQTRDARIASFGVNIVLLLLGLPLILDRSPINVARDAGRCLAVCGACYVLNFFAQRLSPGAATALPVWLPIMVFAPVAFVLLDRVKT